MVRVRGSPLEQLCLSLGTIEQCVETSLGYSKRAGVENVGLSHTVTVKYFYIGFFVLCYSLDQTRALK